MLSTGPRMSFDALKPSPSLQGALHDLSGLLPRTQSQAPDCSAFTTSGDCGAYQVTTWTTVNSTAQRTSPNKI